MYKMLNGSNFKFYQTENSDTTLLIFTGIVGSVDGYNEKYVKIGYADDVKRRLKELNRSECTPFAFRLYDCGDGNNYSIK